MRDFDKMDMVNPISTGLNSYSKKILSGGCQIFFLIKSEQGKRS